MKILVVKTVFCPRDDYFETSFNNIINLFDVLDKNAVEYDADIYILGWCKREKYRKNLEKLMETNWNKIYHDLFPHNYGKLFAFNKIKELLKQHPEYEYVFYSDHDIVFENKISEYVSPLLKFIDSDVSFDQKNAGGAPNVLELGVIFLNQKGDVRHKASVYANMVVYDGHTLAFADDMDTGAYASGCMFVSSRCLLSFGVFQCTSVYGLDEYFLLKHVTSGGRFACCLAHDLYVTHPYDNHKNNKTYVEWKHNSVKRTMDKIKNKSMSDNNYLAEVLKSNNLW